MAIFFIDSQIQKVQNKKVTANWVQLVKNEEKATNLSVISLIEPLFG